MEQIAGIFSGAITDWSAVGRAPGRIQVYARDDKSGTFDTFNSLVLKPTKAALTADARRFESSEELSDSVARDANGIGFVGFAYLRNAKALEIGSNCGMAYAPTVFNVKTEQYPLSRRLYVYANNVAEGRSPRSFSHSRARRRLRRSSARRASSTRASRFWSRRIRSCGLPTASSGLGPDADATLLKDLASGLKHSSRVSTTLQFRLSSAQVDSKTVADVERIAAYVRDLSASDPGRTVILAGIHGRRGRFLRATKRCRKPALNRREEI